MSAGNWDDLRIFLEVARREHLSAAARALRIDPATAGRRISRLEADVGAALFRKSPQGYALTDAGQRLARQTENVARIIRGVDGSVADTGTELSGQVRIGAPDGCATYLLPQICADIAKEYPALDIQIVALPRVFNLSKREADMAITVSPPETARLRVEKLCAYHLHLVASEAYLAANGCPTSLDDLKTHKLIGYIPDLIFDRELDYLGETGAARVDFASNSVSVQLAWARVGAGVTIAHDFALPSTNGAVRPLLTDTFSLTRNFYLVRHADDAHNARLATFADALLKRFAPELARLETAAHR